MKKKQYIRRYKLVIQFLNPSVHSYLTLSYLILWHYNSCTWLYDIYKRIQKLRKIAHNRDFDWLFERKTWKKKIQKYPNAFHHFRTQQISVSRILSLSSQKCDVENTRAMILEYINTNTRIIQLLFTWQVNWEEIQSIYSISHLFPICIQPIVRYSHEISGEKKRNEKWKKEKKRKYRRSSLTDERTKNAYITYIFSLLFHVGYENKWRGEVKICMKPETLGNSCVWPRNRGPFSQEETPSEQKWCRVKDLSILSPNLSFRHSSLPSPGWWTGSP